MLYMRKLKNLRKQQGIVIVVALFIVALVAAMAYVMMARLERDTRRTQLILRNAQSEYYAQASVLWAMDLLRANIEKKKPNSLVDNIPIIFPENQQNGYWIKSSISDMQSRFNINTLNQANGIEGFERLLKAILPEMKAEQSKAIVRAVAYRAAHKPMLNVSELRLVKGITASIFQTLEPYITALPSDAALNVQTASAPVLTTLSPSLTLEAAKTLVAVRMQKPFLTTEAFKPFDVKGFKLTAVSNFFLVETQVSIENQEAVLYTLLERTARGNKAAVAILWQSKGRG